MPAAGSEVKNRQIYNMIVYTANNTCMREGDNRWTAGHSSYLNVAQLYHKLSKVLLKISPRGQHIRRPPFQIQGHSVELSGQNFNAFNVWFSKRFKCLEHCDYLFDLRKTKLININITTLISKIKFKWNKALNLFQLLTEPVKLAKNQHLRNFQGPLSRPVQCSLLRFLEASLILLIQGDAVLPKTKKDKN